MAFMDRLAVTLEFCVEDYREIESEIKQRAYEFFHGEEYTAGWVDVTVTEDGLIKVSANVFIRNDDSPNFPTELGGQA